VPQFPIYLVTPLCATVFLAVTAIRFDTAICMRCGERRTKRRVTALCLPDRRVRKFSYNITNLATRRSQCTDEAMAFRAYAYRVAPQKNWHIFPYDLTSSILTNFQTYFTVRIRRQSVIILSLNIPSHLTRVATLP